MGKSLSTFFIILVFILWAIPKISLGQQIPSLVRENLILVTLNQLQTTEEAIEEAMKEAQLKVMEEKLIEAKEKGFSFKDLASRAHPYLTIQTKFDDNVDSTPTTRKSSLINTITPGLKMNFRGKGRSLNLDMYIDNAYYNNRSRSNSQGITTYLLSNFGIERYTLSISDNYFSNYISTEELGINQVTNYWKNAFSSTLGRHFNRIGFDVGYSRTDYFYEPKSDANDYTDETFSFNQYLRIATKTRLLFEYSRGRTKYPHVPTSDSNYNNFNLAATGVLSSKLTSMAKMGYKVTDNKGAADTRDTTFTTDVGYRVSDRTNLTFTLKHSIHESATKSSYYIQDDFKLSGNHRLAFNPKFNLSFGYEADLKDYPKKAGFTGESNTYTWNFGLSYAFRRWLDFSLTYTNEKITSDVDTEYNRNTITFKTQAKF